jgi:hypothetical protein
LRQRSGKAARIKEKLVMARSIVSDNTATQDQVIEQEQEQDQK